MMIRLGAKHHTADENDAGQRRSARERKFFTIITHVSTEKGGRDAI